MHRQPNRSAVASTVVHADKFTVGDVVEASYKLIAPRGRLLRSGWPAPATGPGAAAPVGCPR